MIFNEAEDDLDIHGHMNAPCSFSFQIHAAVVYMFLSLSHSSISALHHDFYFHLHTFF